MNWSGVLKKPYSGTFDGRATGVQKLNQRSPKVKRPMTHKFLR
jgi:hypothetical protein